MAWSRTKTVVVVTVVTLVGMAIGVIAVKKIVRWRIDAVAAKRAAEFARLRVNTWPAERAEAIEKIKARQAVDETTAAVPIDLTRYANAKLTDAPLCWHGNNANNLAELPAGLHLYGGVPFKVAGAIYLNGGWLKHYHKTLPSKVEGIQIDRRCTKVHLLHGAGYVLYAAYGKPVARLILHYDDGSHREIDILAGKNVCDMWVPLFTSGLPVKYLDMNPGSEPAWTGSNEYIKKWQPDLSLVLYRSTFDNPQPDVTLASIDFVSTETMSVPMMVGLTVE
jgi:hypothetical protein